MDTLLQKFIVALQTRSTIEEKVDETLSFFLYSNIFPISERSAEKRAQDLLNDQPVEFYSLLLDELEASCIDDYFELFMIWPHLLESLNVSDADCCGLNVWIR